VTVPVLDRGPYVAGRDYDLTEAVKERLGFPGVGTVLATR
jgi:rare lipoprotein A